MQKTREELERFIAALTRLAPTQTFGGITLSELEADETALHAHDSAVEENEATLDASRDDRKSFYKATDKKLEKVKNGIIGDPEFGPNSPLYGALGCVRESERKSGLTRKKKDEDK